MKLTARSLRDKELMQLHRLPEDFLQIFVEEEEQLRILAILLRRLDALETALLLRNAPGIIHASQNLGTELLMLGFKKLAQTVSMINDSPLDKSLMEEFQLLLRAWKTSYLSQSSR